MANQVSNFQFQNNALRVIVINGEPWFLAADVCRIIGITSPTKAVKILDDDEVALKTFQGLTNGNDEANFISESGMYKIVMRSQDAIKKGTPAHAFTKWVTSEVLPAIRKTGSYSISISKTQQGELATLIAERFPSGKDRPYAWSRFNNHFRLASYKDLPENRFEEACEYIRTMPEQMPALPRPSVNLLDKDYFAKVRDIANKFADDWVRVGKGEDVHPTLTIPDDVLAGIVAQQLSRQNFRLYIDYAGALSVEVIPNKSPYEGLAKAIADPTNTGLADEVIEEIGAACVKALAYRAKQRKSVISKITRVK